MASDYKILSDSNSTKLADEVKKHLANGWKLHGGLQVTKDDRYVKNYTQAMIKDKE